MELLNIMLVGVELVVRIMVLLAQMVLVKVLVEVLEVMANQEVLHIEQDQMEILELCLLDMLFQHKV
jgi:hypothetical protein